MGFRARANARKRKNASRNQLESCLEALSATGRAEAQNWYQSADIVRNRSTGSHRKNFIPQSNQVDGSSDHNRNQRFPSSSNHRCGGNISEQQ